AGSLDWPTVTLTSPILLPIGDMNAVHGLIVCTTSPDKGSLNVGMVASALCSKMLCSCCGAKVRPRNDGSKQWRDGWSGRRHPMSHTLRVIRNVRRRTYDRGV